MNPAEMIMAEGTRSVCVPPAVPNTERCRDKTVLVAAADQSRVSTIKVSVTGSTEQSSLTRRPGSAFFPNRHRDLSRLFAPIYTVK